MKTNQLNWYSKVLSNQINLPSKNDNKKILINNTSFKSYSYNFYNNLNNNRNLKNKLRLDAIKQTDIKYQTINLIEKYNKDIIKTKNSNKHSNHEIKTKLEKQKKLLTSKINDNKNIIKTKIIYFFPNQKQKYILFSWLKECNRIYNYCVYLYNKNDENKKYFENNSYMKTKLKIFKDLYGTKKKPIPYDILTDEVRIFHSNLKSCLSNYKNKNISHFTLKYKKQINTQSILIPKKSVNQNGIFTNKLKKLNFGKKNTYDINHIKPECDCRLYYNNLTKRFSLNIPTKEIKKEIDVKHEIVALDPGEKNFMSFYSLDNYGFIGTNIRNEFLNIQKKIKKCQSDLLKKKNKQGKKLKNKKKLKQKIDRYYKKLKNLRNECHNKTSNYLCKNYKKIILPDFSSKDIIRKNHNTKIKISKNINKINDMEHKKEELKNYKKKNRLASNVKFVLNMLSHYKFRLHLSNKCREYGNELISIDESYTSKTCTHCGLHSNLYINRNKKCSCKFEIDRDINGSRNILLKYLYSLKCI